MAKALKAQRDVGVVAGLGFRAGLHMTSGMTAAADAFLRALRSGSLVRARSCLARESRKLLDDRLLQQWMGTECVVAFGEASFPDRHVRGDRGELSGSVITRSGAAVPVRLELVHQGGGWKVCGFLHGDRLGFPVCGAT